MDRSRPPLDSYAALAQVAQPDGLYLLPAALDDPSRSDPAWRVAEEQIAALVLIVSLLIVVAVLSLA
jgi:hypothetical protein